MDNTRKLLVHGNGGNRLDGLETLNNLGSTCPKNCSPSFSPLFSSSSEVAVYTLPVISIAEIRLMEERKNNTASNTINNNKRIITILRLVFPFGRFFFRTGI